MKFLVVLAVLLGYALATDYGRPYPRNNHGSGYRNSPYGRPGYGYYYKICPKLPTPENGEVAVSGRHPGKTAVYSCDVGYNLVGEDTRTCQRNGVWSKDAPICEIVVCGAPDPADPNGSVTVGSNTYLSTAVYSCNRGFLLDTSEGGSKVVTCQADGQWSDTAPGCVPVDCGSLPAPANGFVVFDPDTTFESEARFSCKRGFELIGDSVRKCQYNGLWSLQQPSCQRIQCPKLSAPKFGKVVVFGYYVDDYAIYRCAYGYGKTRRVCLEDGSWSGPEPECKGRPSYHRGYGKYSDHSY